MSLPTELFERRRRLDLTQQQAGQGADLSRQAVTEIETGASDPHLSSLQRLAASYGCRLRLELLDADDHS